MITGKKIIAVGKQTVLEFIEDDGLRLSASLAFYSVLSLAPILIFILALAGTIWSSASAQIEVSRYVTQFAGPLAAETVLAILENTSNSADTGLATTVGFVVLIFGATVAFAELQDGLNTLWRIVDVRSQVRGFLRRRIVSLAIVFVIAALLMLSVVATTVLGIAARFLQTGAHIGEWAWFLLHQSVSLGTFVLLFAAMFKLLPSTRAPWRRVWAGAAFTALMFLVGEYFIRLYIEHTSIGSSYGAAGSVIALLLWIYYSAIIFYLGAKLTSVLTRYHAGEVASAAVSVDPATETPQA